MRQRPKEYEFYNEEYRDCTAKEEETARLEGTSKKCPYQQLQTVTEYLHADSIVLDICAECEYYKMYREHKRIV